MKKLEDLQVGDEVIVACSTHTSVCTVIRNAELYVEVKVGDSILMFSKKNGRQKGCCGFGASRILVATDELKAEVEDLNRRNKYQLAIHMCNMYNLSTDKLEQIYKIIKSEEK